MRVEGSIGTYTAHSHVICPCGWWVEVNDPSVNVLLVSQAHADDHMRWGNPEMKEAEGCGLGEGQMMMDQSDPGQEAEAAVRLLKDFVASDTDHGHVRLDWHQARAITALVDDLYSAVLRLTPPEPF
jgi:hypothetical protein